MVVIECTFHQNLSVEDLSWSLYIPSKIIPRYNGDFFSELRSSMTEEEFKELLEEVDEVIRVYYQDIDLNFDFELQLNSSSPITRIISKTHKINIEFTNDKETNAIIKLIDLSTLINFDFNLLFRNMDINKPIILTQKLGDERALMVSFLADLMSEIDKEVRLTSITSKIDIDPLINYEDYLNINYLKREYYFILDRSGSMAGKRIENVKKSLILFLRSLPSGSKFNIISVGTDFSTMHTNVVDYDQEKLDLAISEIKQYDADMGGTEIYGAFEYIFSKNDDPSSLSKHVYLLTDGQIENTDEVIKLIKANNSNFTVHTIGIGNSVSTALVVGCANAGKGNYYFVNNKGKWLEETVIEALIKSYYPYINIKDQILEWNGNTAISIHWKFSNSSIYFY